MDALSEQQLEEIVATDSAGRIAKAVARLRDALDAGTYLEIALRDVLLDSTAEEQIALLRVLGLPIEPAELTAQRRADAGEAFLAATSDRERDEALSSAFPELAGDDDEEYI